MSRRRLRSRVSAIFLSLVFLVAAANAHATEYKAGLNWRVFGTLRFGPDLIQTTPIQGQTLQVEDRDYAHGCHWRNVSTFTVRPFSLSVSSVSTNAPSCSVSFTRSANPSASSTVTDFLVTDSNGGTGSITLRALATLSVSFSNGPGSNVFVTADGFRTHVGWNTSGATSPFETTFDAIETFPLGVPTTPTCPVAIGVNVGQRSNATVSLRLGPVNATGPIFTMPDGSPLPPNIHVNAPSINLVENYLLPSDPVPTEEMTWGALKSLFR